MARDGERGRGDWKARRGSRNSGPYAGSDDTGPVDIAAVRRDDALIDAIASNGQVQTDSTEEFQLAALLADWRAELVSPPMPAAPDLDEIVAAVNQEIGARQVRLSAHTGGRLRLVRPILGAAAALALVVGGMSAFSYSAEPGDPLWRVKEVVFSEQAQTTVVQRADSELANAKVLLDQGSPEQAKTKLEAAKVNAAQIDDPAKREERMSQLDALLAELAKVAPDIANSILPSTPAKPTPGTDGTTVPTTKPGDSAAVTVPPVVTKPPVDTKLPTTDPATPGNPTVPTTPPPVTIAPTTPPKNTGVPPTTVGSPPTVVEPTIDTGAPPAQPPTRPNPQTGGNTFPIPTGFPSLPGLPGTGPTT